MELLPGHAFGPQMSTLDILEAGSAIYDITNPQPIAEVGKNRRICRRQCRQPLI
jgi:hypothetical protein